MIRCRRCLLPDTKPDLRLIDGVCSACHAFALRPTIDWDERKAAFLRLVEECRTHPVYDVVVPSSGGKDSTAQTLKMLELGLNPLVVTATTDHLTDLGRRNIENLKRQGVDSIEVSLNPVVRRKLNRIALTEVGDISWPEHASIFSLPVRIAQAMGVGLVVYGENPQSEYGGPKPDAIVLDERWGSEFGGFLGLRPSDLVGREGITEKDIWPYTWPTVTSTCAVFLGQFFEWDGQRNATIAQAHGFEFYRSIVEGSAVSYENLDNAQTGIHDYFKFLKYSFGRATDITSTLIRRGRLSREEGLAIVRKHDGRFPESYLGVSLFTILDEIGMTYNDFLDVCDRFANPELLERSKPGHWHLKESA